jgi:hypothetical protein
MAGRLSKPILSTDRVFITPFEMNRILGRTRYAPGFEYMIHEHNKWTIVARVPQYDGNPDNLVEAEFVLDPGSVEASVPITSGLKDFLGPENWRWPERYANNPHGPVEMDFINDVPTLDTAVWICRVGSLIKPFIVFHVTSAQNLVEVTNRLFKIPADVPVEPVTTHGPIMIRDDE